MISRIEKPRKVENLPVVYDEQENINYIYKVTNSIANCADSISKVSGSMAEINAQGGLKKVF